jgi:hypothetical protein
MFPGFRCWTAFKTRNCEKRRRAARIPTFRSQIARSKIVEVSRGQISNLLRNSIHLCKPALLLLPNAGCRTEPRKRWQALGPKSQSAESESQIIGKGSNDIFSFSELRKRGNDVRRVFFGHFTATAFAKQKLTRPPRA